MKQHGLTLLELMIGLAVMAVMASLAAPSFSAMLARSKLKSVAEALASDVAEARFEAAKRGQTLHITAVSGAGWCWAVATTADCACGEAPSCALKTVRARDHAGVALLQAGSTQLQSTGLGLAASTLFESSRGDRLRVDVSPLGRASICAPAAKVPGYTDCPGV